MGKIERWCSAALLSLAVSIVAVDKSAAVEWTMDKTSVTLTGSAGVGVFVAPNANFGAGSYDIRAVRDFAQGLRFDAGTPTTSPSWYEAFLKPSLKISHEIAPGEFLFGSVSAVYSQTLGDGDSFLTSTTPGNPGSVGVEEAYLGYRGPPPFGLKGDSLIVQFGRQDLLVDDGLLVHYAPYNIGGLGCLYLTPRTGFDGWGTIRLNTDPVRADVFVLSTPVDNTGAYGSAQFAADQPDTNFAGFDIQWFENAARAGAAGAVNYLDRARYLSFTYFNIYQSDRNPLLYGDDSTAYWARRDGLNVFSLAGGGQLMPLDVLSLRENGLLYFQYIREINTNPGRKVDATGYYIEPGYRFQAHPWTPYLYYRYSHFSGQPGIAGAPMATKHSYDPLFLGGGLRDAVGNYALGEIVGGLMLASSNLNVHQAAVKVTAPFHLLGRRILCPSSSWAISSPSIIPSRWARPRAASGRRSM